MTPEELKIMAAALPAVEAVPYRQNICWPGDGGHDGECHQGDHAASAAAVAATEGLVWEFDLWSETADWFRSELGAAPPVPRAKAYLARIQMIGRGIRPISEPAIITINGQPLTEGQAMALRDEDEVEIGTGPFCRHYSHPLDCDEKCARCGHPCGRHHYGNEESECFECGCEAWQEPPCG